ncbi:hypothetical protein EJB05_25211 [Eragrostis curvula]|uniref:Uncharacterized protein n=1 Tax=Eragrostis curvula TaxID=38414 RepID=A0A5J9VBR1_9POAL|nr:hypothetical protein EJB05_25211 [Eragrostis curvula]
MPLNLAVVWYFVFIWIKSAVFSLLLLPGAEEQQALARSASDEMRHLLSEIIVDNGYGSVADVTASRGNAVLPWVTD